MIRETNPVVIVAGNIGVGKTSFTSKLAKMLGGHAFYESVEDNPYLDDFYVDPKRWAFELQIYFLSHRLRMHSAAFECNMPAVIDRSIYEDANIFAWHLHNTGVMKQREYSTYRMLFNLMVDKLPVPTAMVYLDAPVGILMKRIAKRGRDCEKSGISHDYLLGLAGCYSSWISTFDLCPLLTVYNTGDLDDAVRAAAGWLDGLKCHDE